MRRMASAPYFFWSLNRKPGSTDFTFANIPETPDAETRGPKLRKELVETIPAYMVSFNALTRRLHDPFAMSPRFLSIWVLCRH